MLGKSNFKLSENTRYNIGMGYTMSPFGDFIDENIWIKYRNINVGLYARQFQNKENWFHGFGISLNEYQPIERLSISMTGHFWEQPTDFDFNAETSFTGGAIDTDIRYWFLNNRENGIDGFSIDLGFIYKSKGFLPEELNMDEHFGIRLGTSLRL